MAQSFFVSKPTATSGYTAVTSSGNPTLVEPVELEPVTVFSPENGGYIENTAVSGQQIYAHGVWPSDYPSDDEERQRRRGAVRKKL
jgi:hypothetical protein